MVHKWLPTCSKEEKEEEERRPEMLRRRKKKKKNNATTRTGSLVKRKIKSNSWGGILRSFRNAISFSFSLPPSIFSLLFFPSRIVDFREKKKFSFSSRYFFFVFQEGNNGEKGRRKREEGGSGKREREKKERILKTRPLFFSEDSNLEILFFSWKLSKSSSSDGGPLKREEMEEEYWSRARIISSFFLWL